MISDHYMFEDNINPDFREKDVTLLFSGEGRPHPAHKIGPSVHDYFLIHSVLEGKGSFAGRINTAAAVPVILSSFFRAYCFRMRPIRKIRGIMHGSP